ncbi:MAG: GLUG motif-containing protein [Paludibacteraceae bacterium]
MKKKFTQFRWLAATLMFVATMVMPSTAWAQGTITPSQPTNGDGKADSPYEIGTAEELYWFAGLVNGDASVCTGDVTQNKAACAKLTTDIEVNSNLLANLNADGTVKDGYEVKIWTPIGNKDNPYAGTFDGNGKTVSGLYFNNTSTDYVGLFGYVYSGTIKNVGVVDSYFKGSSYVGGVCGYVYSSGGTSTATITNCYNTGSVSGSLEVGGVCGRNHAYSVVGTAEAKATITNCYNAGSVSGTGNVGGVCGRNYAESYGGTAEATITNCHNTGSVSGTGYVGGVCGQNYAYSESGTAEATATITNCHNTGSASGSGSNVGGVCGYNEAFSNGGTAEATITSCYNTGSVSGSVSGSSNVGGVCGRNYAESSAGTAKATITNCYNTGSVSGSSNVGGVCGYNRAYSGGGTAEATITNCYYDSEKYTGKAVGNNVDGTVNENNVTGKTTDEFKSGEVCYLLNGSSSDGVWGQTLSGTGEQDYPVLGGIPVYYRNEIYTNTYGTLTEGTHTITASSSPYVWYEFTPLADGTYLFVAAPAVLVREDISVAAAASPYVAKELVVGTTYYVCIPGAPTPEAELTIKKFEASLKVGKNTVYITEPDATWYEFTPAVNGIYQFSSTTINGGICVNTEKTINGMQGMSSAPIYSLSAETTYYVYFSCALGEYDLTIANLSTTLVLGDNKNVMVSTSGILWYEFTPTESGTYQFSSSALEAGYLYVNTTKAEDESTYIPYAPAYELTAGTTYYVAISYNPGTYDLTIKKLDTMLKVGSNEFEVSAPLIWYEFTPTATGTYQFSGTMTAGNLYVNTTKTEDDDDKDITSEPTYELTAETTYYVAVSAEPGSYGLTITKLGTTTALDAVASPQIYAVDGRLVCAGECRIYDLLGRDVTRLNGSLHGVYVVKTTDTAVKIVVR